MRRFFFGLLKIALLLLLLAIVAGVLLVPGMNDYQTDGSLRIAGLSAPVEVRRDEQGIPYIEAKTADDLWLAQGFVTAQDRLFQMQLTRLFAEGRLGELAGERTRDLDLRMRTYGFARLAKKQAALLDEPSRRHFQRYADGVNAMIEAGDDLPLEFQLAGIKPDRWTVEASLAIAFYMSWNSSANLNHEILADALERKLGQSKAELLRPINWNPDLEKDPIGQPAGAVMASARPTTSPAVGEMLAALAVSPAGPLGFDLAGATKLGSNNWAVGAGRSPSGKPIVANDPHLDARMLPGVWHPVGLILPTGRAFGATVPGLPGVTVGRSNQVAMSVTNAYADIQDLYVESVDPGNPSRYLDGGVSMPFEVYEEVFRFKDAEAPEGYKEEKRQVRATRRGPVVSDVLEDKVERPSSEVISLRWAPAETMATRLGFWALLEVNNVDELDAELAKLTFISLNFVFADDQGNLGFRVSGRPPRREVGTGTRPTVIDKALPTADNWQGFLGPDEMPHQKNPERGWLGTANHLTASPNLPYYFTDFAASTYRYRRMQEVLNAPQKLSVQDHWQLQRDTKNLLAQRLVPIFVTALEKDEETKDLAAILKLWNFRDEAEGAAPLVFQETLRQAVLATLEDELGAELTLLYLDGLYYWQERFESMLVEGHASFFDDAATPKRENREEILIRAGKAAKKVLEPKVGSDPRDWQWGDLHTITFFHPLRREGLGAAWLGSEPLPMAGSAETLLRGWYNTESPYPVTHFASLRFVADLGDDDKMLWVLPGGVVARAFHAHFKDQLPAYMSGEERYFWVSDRAIATHTVDKLVLEP